MCFNKVLKNYLAAICAEATGHDIWINLHKAALKTCQVTVAMGSEKRRSTVVHAVQCSLALQAVEEKGAEASQWQKKHFSNI